jgi:hypothetical protein
MWLQVLSSRLKLKKNLTELPFNTDNCTSLFALRSLFFVLPSPIILTYKMSDTPSLETKSSSADYPDIVYGTPDDGFYIKINKDAPMELSWCNSHYPEMVPEEWQIKQCYVFQQAKLKAMWLEGQEILDKTPEAEWRVLNAGTPLNGYRFKSWGSWHSPTNIGMSVQITSSNGSGSECTRLLFLACRMVCGRMLFALKGGDVYSLGIGTWEGRNNVKVVPFAEETFRAAPKQIPCGIKVPGWH